LLEAEVFGEIETMRPTFHAPFVTNLILIAGMIAFFQQGSQPNDGLVVNARSLTVTDGILLLDNDGRVRCRLGWAGSEGAPQEAVVLEILDSEGRTRFSVQANDAGLTSLKTLGAGIAPGGFVANAQRDSSKAFVGSRGYSWEISASDENDSGIVGVERRETGEIGRARLVAYRDGATKLQLHDADNHETLVTSDPD
jgi:hypothetical protein